jgi:carboxypeptidase Taq
MNGDIECEDLPGLWDEKMNSLLGLRTLGNEKDGVLQDVHWPSGAFGYFPCYTMGAIIAAQLARALKSAQPKAFSVIAHGDFGPIQDWLRQHIWSQGRRYSTAETIELATGDAINPQAFLDHLKARYVDASY